MTRHLDRLPRREVGVNLPGLLDQLPAQRGSRRGSPASARSRRRASSAGLPVLSIGRSKESGSFAAMVFSICLAARASCPCFSGKRRPAPFVRSTRRAVPANGASSSSLLLFLAFSLLSLVLAAPVALENPHHTKFPQKITHRFGASVRFFRQTAADQPGKVGRNVRVPPL